MTDETVRIYGVESRVVPMPFGDLLDDPEFDFPLLRMLSAIDAWCEAHEGDAIEFEQVEDVLEPKGGASST